MTRLRRAWIWFVAQGPIIVAFVVLSTSVLLTSVFQVVDEINESNHQSDATRQIDRLQYEQECRFELSLPVSEAQAAKLDGLAAGLVALEEEDEAELALQVENIRRARLHEQEALERRAGAVQECRDRAELLFGP